MNRAARLLTCLAVVTMAAWGCSQGPSSRAALVERIKTLEEKNARVEDDLRTMVAVRDQIKQQLNKAEDHIQRLQLVVKERDELRQVLIARTGERDQVLAQYDQFRKSLKDLVTQADASVLRFPDGEPVIVSISVSEYQRTR